MKTIRLDKFQIVLLHNFPCNSKDELVAEEMRVMNTYIAAGTTVYNSVIDGKPDAAVREKMALAHQGKKHTDDEKKKIGAASRKRWEGHCGNIRLSVIKGSVPQWRFTYTKNGKQICRSFSTEKYGFQQAKLLAEEERIKVFPDWKSDEAVVDHIVDDTRQLL